MSKRHSRHGFLGPRAQEIIGSPTLGIVGANGGGSHFIQQFGHIGFRRFVIYDPEAIDDGSNLSRNVLATTDDCSRGSLKVELAQRRLRAVADGELTLETYACTWQKSSGPLKRCDVILGAVDTFAQRNELEACARRYMIPYVDIGLDVTTVPGEPPRMAGQVILSMPGGPCMWCLGFLNAERLGAEARRYGDTGPRPQVVWANGTLASTAVGIAVDLFCDWTRGLRRVVYLSYDGNVGTVTPHPRLDYVGHGRCPHYPLTDVGEPRFTAI